MRRGAMSSGASARPSGRPHRKAAEILRGLVGSDWSGLSPIASGPLSWTGCGPARSLALEPGKQADVIVMGLPDYREIPYYFGVNHCETTIKRGKIIYARNGEC